MPEYNSDSGTYFTGKYGSRSNRPQTKSALVKSAPSQIGPSQIDPTFVVYYCQHAKLNRLNTIQQKLNINVWLYLAMLKIINNIADKSSVSAYIWCTFPPCTLSIENRKKSSKNVPNQHKDHYIIAANQLTQPIN